MFVKQISVYLENTNGMLAGMTQVLGDGGVDLIALSIADAEKYGILRIIASDTDEAVKLLRGALYPTKVDDVLAVAISDEPGGLHKALSLFDQRGISIDYLYSFLHRSDRAYIILKAKDGQAAAQAVTDAGSQLLTEEQVRAL